MKRWMSCLVLALLIVSARPGGIEAAVLINEVLADPAGDANGDGSVHSTRDEFIELVNTEADPLSLANWSLSDLTQVRHVFPETTSIPGRGFFVVFGGGSPQGFSDFAVASSGGLGLNNTGDTVTLFNGESSLIDAFTYGSEGGQDVSLARSPDATGPFVLHSSVSALAFSPGATTEGLAQLPAPPAPPADPGPPPVDEEPSSPGDPASPPESDPGPPSDPGDGSTDPEPPSGDAEPPATDPGAPSGDPIPPVLGPPFEEAPDADAHPVVPEPSSFLLLGAGMLGLPLVRRRCA